jgi:hypothetical protein
MQANGLTEEQFATIVDHTHGRDCTIEAVLSDLSLALPANEVEAELRRGGFERCAVCGIWSFSIVDEYCEFCQDDEGLTIKQSAALNRQLWEM